MTNNSRRFEKGGRPDWPSFRIRNISPELWEKIKHRAIVESADGNPRLNGICLHLLQVYAEQGLPALEGFPKRLDAVGAKGGKATVEYDISDKGRK